MSLETIVLAADGEGENIADRLAATAADIADPSNAEIILAHVFDDEEYENARSRLNFTDDSEVTPSAIAERTVSVRDLGETLAGSDIDVTASGRLSNGASQGQRLVELADEVDADMIVLGGRGRSPAGKALFGSTVQDVMLESSCPVTFVRAA
jgi:nucleotide-binding universal stress UspA family protein